MQPQISIFKTLPGVDGKFVAEPHKALRDGISLLVVEGDLPTQSRGMVAETNFPKSQTFFPRRPEISLVFGGDINGN